MVMTGSQRFSKVLDQVTYGSLRFAMVRLSSLRCGEVR